MKKTNSVYANMVLNVVKTLMSIAFPLITYPYATRVLNVVNFGKVNYAQSIVSYISLIAGLGIASYAIREGGVYRSDSKHMNRFVSEVFSFNVLTTVIAYIFLGCFLLFANKFKDYSLLILILSLSTLFTTIGVDWINVIYEDYLYITVRSFIIQILSIVLLFVFVKSEHDYYVYAWIQVIGNGLISFSNLFYTRRYCKIKLRLRCNIQRHIKPVLILFSNSLAVTIYSSVDNLLLGYLRGDYFVGLYSVSVKIYSILKQVVAATYMVTVTRLTEYISQRKEQQYSELLNSIINNIILLCVPVTIGLICISDSVVFILAGENYLPTVTALRVLSLAIIFSVLGGALAYCVNLPHHNEKKNLICTSFSAIENLVLNLWFIPNYGVNGAAITTLISEFSVFLVLLLGMKKYWVYFNFKKIIVNGCKSFCASLPIIALSRFLNMHWNYSSLTYLFVLIPSAVAFFIGINLALKNECFTSIFRNVINRVKTS